jgi:hypothetical protein
VGLRVSFALSGLLSGAILDPRLAPWALISPLPRLGWRALLADFVYRFAGDENLAELRSAGQISTSVPMWFVVFHLGSVLRPRAEVQGLRADACFYFWAALVEGIWIAGGAGATITTSPGRA